MFAFPQSVHLSICSYSVLPNFSLFFLTKQINCLALLEKQNILLHLKCLIQVHLHRLYIVSCTQTYYCKMLHFVHYAIRQQLCVCESFYKKSKPQIISFFPHNSTFLFHNQLFSTHKNENLYFSKCKMTQTSKSAKQQRRKSKSGKRYSGT